MTSTLVLEGQGTIGEYAGGYTDWLRQRRVAEVEAPVREKRAAAAVVVAAKQVRSEKARKLSFGEKKELAGLPELIEARERERDAIYASLADGTFLRDGAAVVYRRERVSRTSRLKSRRWWRGGRSWRRLRRTDSRHGSK